MGWIFKVGMDTLIITIIISITHSTENTAIDMEDMAMAKMVEKMVEMMAVKQSRKRRLAREKNDFVVIIEGNQLFRYTPRNQVPIYL